MRIPQCSLLPRTESTRCAALRACLSVRLQGAPMPAHANKKPPTRLELKQAYEAELRVSRPARLSACQL